MSYGVWMSRTPEGSLHIAAMKFGGFGAPAAERNIRPVSLPRSLRCIGVRYIRVGIQQHYEAGCS